MNHLLLTHDSPAANVAIDEALLEAAEAGQIDSEILRLWEPQTPMVVLGRSSSIHAEAKLDVCEEAGAPVIRRCSGGATILTAPGCLMYAVLLSYDRRPELRMLENAHQFVMSKIQNSIANCGVTTEFEGTCDLTIDHRKVSGNALRCKKNWLIYHGTLICENMDVDLIGKCLGSPKRQPDYRAGRTHADFLTRMPISTANLASALLDEWECNAAQSDWPETLTNELLNTKYEQEDWNYKL